VSPGASQPPSDTSLDRGTWIVAGVVIVGMVMSILDTTIVNVALDSLSRDLHAPLSTLQWVSTGYLLSLAMVIPLAGWMSERFGSKRIWMVSVTLFGLGSAVVRARRFGGHADFLPGAARLGGRDDHAGRHDRAGADGRAPADRPGDVGGRPPGVSIPAGCSLGGSSKSRRRADDRNPSVGHRCRHEHVTLE
jgi:hypothetical protein